MPELLYTFRKQHEEKFLELIASGELEEDALAQLHITPNKPLPMAIYILYLAKSPEFRERVEEAKRRRADKWFGDIVKSSKDTSLSKDDAAVEKLKFEQRKYLAAIDNPEKYSEKVRHEHNHSLNIFAEIKNLSSADAKKILNSVDPFAPQVVDAEYTVKSSDLPKDKYAEPPLTDDEIRRNLSIPMEDSPDEEEEDIFS